MKAVKILAVLCLVSGCAGDGVYGVDNPNAGRNAAATGSAVGAGAALAYGLVGIAVFASAMESLSK